MITRQLPKKEYDYLESVTDGYGVYWFPEVKAFLAPNEKQREEFIDYLTGNYKGLPESYPIYQARGRQEVLRTLQDVYDISTYNSYLEKMNWADAKEHIIGIVDKFAKAGQIKYSDGKIEYADESAKKSLEDLFHINEKASSAKNYNEVPNGSIIFTDRGLEYKNSRTDKNISQNEENKTQEQDNSYFTTGEYISAQGKKYFGAFVTDSRFTRDIDKI